MQSADAVTPAPTYGHVRELEQALDGSVLAERPVQHREDDVDARRASRGRCDVGTGSVSAAERPSRSSAALRAGAELPAPVAADLDGHRLVARRVERLDHRARRGERDLVLARAPAHDDGDAEPGPSGRGDEPADDDRHRRARFRLRPADRVLGEDDPVLVRVGRVLLLDVDREARLLERLLSPSPRPGSSRPGSSLPSGPSRRQRDGSAARPRAAALGSLVDHGVLRLARLDVASRDREAGSLQLAGGAVVELADDVRNVERLEPLRDVDVDGRALVHDAAADAATGRRPCPASSFEKT